MRFGKLSINSISKTIASMKLKRFVRDLETNIGKKLLHDAVIMEGFLDITNGDTVIHGKNSIVDQGLAGIANWISGNTIAYNGSAYPLGSFSWNGSPPGYSTYMVVGSNTSQGTSNGTTGLQSPIVMGGGGGTGTKPNSQSGATSTPGVGQWQVQWTATWNAGTLPATTLGEVGLYLYLIPATQGFQAGAGATTLLFSRMASADGKFTAFTINNAVPLSIAWNFRLTYAT
jgi:hypothetical protein